MNTHDTVVETLKAAPPVSVATLSVFDVSLNEAVLVITAIYTVVLIIDKLPIVFTRFKELAAWVKGLRHGSKR